MRRNPRLMFMVVFAIGLTAGRVSGADESPVPRPDADSIQLPSGTVFKVASFETHPKWKEVFPPDRPFFAEQFSEGQLKGIHSRYVAMLNGASAMLYENGNVKALANYPKGQRQGPCRIWDEEKRMLLYAQYKDDKKHGVTCLFKNGIPWFVQQWNMDSLEKETIVVRKGGEYIPAEDPQELAKAQEKLSAVEKERAGDEGELKKSMRISYVEGTKKFEEEKDKSLYKAIHARNAAQAQRTRQEEDARAAAAHPYGKSGRVAAVDEALAGQDLKGAKRNFNAAKNQLNEKLRAMGTAAEQDSKKLYQFAIVSLESAMPSEASELDLRSPGEVADREKTFIVTYRGGKGAKFTETIRASSPAEAKENVRQRHPNAKFDTIVEDLK